jgi:hypothetical protein
LRQPEIINDKTEGYCVSLAYDEIHRNITDYLGFIEVKDERVTSSNNDIKADFYGVFPKYVLDISKDGKKICCLNIR